MKRIFPCIVFALATMTAGGQTKNQLQKALFAEEVERNPAKAATIYQSMIDDSGESPRYLAMARFRLARIHQQTGRIEDAKVLLKALATDPNAPADWVVQANKELGTAQLPTANTTDPNFTVSELNERLTGKLWHWHSSPVEGAPWGTLRFLPGGAIETTFGLEWLTSWRNAGPNRFRITQVAGKYWIHELSPDGKSSTALELPGVVDATKRLVLHPDQSMSIDEAEIEYLADLVKRNPDSLLKWEVPCKLAKRNRVKAFSFLLDHGFDVDSRERSSLHYTPLMYAVEYGEPATVRFLLDRGADINALDSRGVAPLFIAAVKGRGDLVSLLLDRGAKLENSTSNLRQPDQRLELGTALHGAAMQGHLKVVRLLLERGANIDSMTPLHQQTPLVSALAVGNPEVAKLLLDAGANPNLPLSGNESPLREAAYLGNLAMVRLLLTKGAKPDMQGDLEFPAFGLKRAAGSALEVAARQGHRDVAAALIDAGCPPDHVTPIYQETPLHAAALFGNTSMCALLLEKGANPNHRLADQIGFQSGWLPLHSATWRESPEVVKLLMEKGASPAEPCKDAGDQRTPFHWAVLKGNVTIASAMMDHVAAGGEDKLAALLSQPDAKGNTALHLAVSREAKPNGEMVRKLLASGASQTAVNRSNQTPRQLCLDPELGSNEPTVRSAMEK